MTTVYILSLYYDYSPTIKRLQYSLWSITTTTAATARTADADGHQQTPYLNPSPLMQTKAGGALGGSVRSWFHAVCIMFCWESLRCLIGRCSVLDRCVPWYHVVPSSIVMLPHRIMFRKESCICMIMLRAGTLLDRCVAKWDVFALDQRVVWWDGIPRCASFSDGIIFRVGLSCRMGWFSLSCRVVWWCSMLNNFR